MTDLATFLGSLALLAAFAAAVITGLGKYTLSSNRQIAVATLVTGAFVGWLTHASGLIAVGPSHPMDDVLAALWGVLASFAGAGATKFSLPAGLFERQADSAMKPTL